MSVHGKISKKTVNTILSMKKNNEKITCITAYDYTSAKIVDKAGIDLILVGDSLGMVMNGFYHFSFKNARTLTKCLQNLKLIQYLLANCNKKC